MLIDQETPSTVVTMRAAVMYGAKDIRFEDVPVPEVGPGELLIAVTTVGICGTDASEWAFGPKLFPIENRHPITGHVGPMIFGHEFAGFVAGVGEGVDPVWTGALVASCGSIPCGVCKECVSGRSNLCRRYAAVGLHRAGALAAYVTAPVASCIDVGALGIDAREAALMQPMAIAVHSMRRSGIGPDDVAIVQGVGGIGAFLIHALVQLGARVVAVDLAAERLNIATALGAHVTILAGTPDSAAQISAEFSDSIPVFFEVTGSEPGLQLALELVPMGTNVVLVGIHKALRTVDLARVTVRELSLIGTNALVREIDFPEAAILVALRKGEWGDIAPEPIGLDELVDGALRPMSEGRPPAIKTLIRISW
jgi:(R,R)-butanediol dehydrogenase/meso-butanediol dehydrogenase/diacetyl reductase